jgi:hypothetical protein
MFGNDKNKKTEALTRFKTEIKERVGYSSSIIFARPIPS